MMWRMAMDWLAARGLVRDQRGVETLEWMGIGAVILAFVGVLITLFGGQVGTMIGNTIGQAIDTTIRRWFGI